MQPSRQQQFQLTLSGAGWIGGYLQANLLLCVVAALGFATANICAQVDNIGARRLHTVIERLVEEISFEAPDIVAEASAAAAHGVNESSVVIEEAQPSADQAQGNGDGSIKITRVITDADVRQKLSDLLKQQDYSKFIL